jgi:hypothetical protein
MAARPSFALDLKGAYVPFSFNVVVPFDDTPEDLRYLLAVLNSRPLWFWFQRYAKRRGIGLEINGNVLERTPLRRIDFANAKDRNAHDRLTDLVDRIIKLGADRLTGLSAHDRVSIGREIGGMEKEIDGIVSELYGLSTVDVVSVEAATTLDEEEQEKSA